MRIALRTQQIIAYESGVADSVDPLAGSYLVEQITDELENRVMDYLKRIDDMGGALQAIENGYIQQEIQESAYRYQKAVEKGDQVIVGVNAFEIQENLDLERLKVDPQIEAEQHARLEDLREKRDNSKVSGLKTQLGKCR